HEWETAAERKPGVEETTGRRGNAAQVQSQGPETMIFLSTFYCILLSTKLLEVKELQELKRVTPLNTKKEFENITAELLKLLEDKSGLDNAEGTKRICSKRVDQGPPGLILACRLLTESFSMIIIYEVNVYSKQNVFRTQSGTYGHICSSIKYSCLLYKKGNLCYGPENKMVAARPLPHTNEVIRKRLLIDGDGAGDDRRINLLVKSFIKWCNSGSQEEGYSQYQRMLSTLSQCEFSMGKTLLVYDMNLREMENYEKIYKEIECSIAGAHEKIAECKKQILQAKRIRKNRQEYDALAKVIQRHPDRHETLKELEALGKELEHLSHIKESVEDKLELRRKQFHVLLSTIHELQQTLESVRDIICWTGPVYHFTEVTSDAFDRAVGNSLSCCELLGKADAEQVT
ncbi:hypothetical protein E2I00_009536, partial [Balaenoptera physalus]